jgi:hypothetical protein
MENEHLLAILNLEQAIEKGVRKKPQAYYFKFLEMEGSKAAEPSNRY